METGLIDNLRKEAAELRRELHHFKIVFDNCPMMIWFKDRNNNIIKANQLAALTANTTSEEMENRSTWDYFPEEADKYYQDDLEVINSGKPKLGIIETIQTKDGKIWVQTDKVPWYDEDGKAQGVIVLVSDITDRKRYEDEIYKAQKLKSLGILAGGLAHDLNNLLSGITGNIDLAAINSAKGQDCSIYLNRIKSVLENATRLTQQLLTFSQGGAPLKSTVSLLKLVTDCAELFSAGSNVLCEVSAEEGLLCANIDPGQISQVINNLIVNAQQAMPNGGKIDIKLDNQKLDPSHPKSAGEKSNQYVRISISDRGIGIPPEIIDNIFDPFFSTKENGTGLGLSISDSIVKRHGGFINYFTNDQPGATFEIYLPASNQTPKEELRQKSQIEKLAARVLVMDDDQFILDSMSSMLKLIGCDYTCVNNGTEAIRLFSEAIKTESPYEIVILDLTIHGGLGGKETIKELRKLGANFKAVVSSGYSNDAVMAAPKEYGFDNVLRKPYGMENLRQLLKEIISNCPILKARNAL